MWKPAEFEADGGTVPNRSKLNETENTVIVDAWNVVVCCRCNKKKRTCYILSVNTAKPKYTEPKPNEAEQHCV